MFERTDTEHAPWRIVPADSKRYARVQVMHEVIAAIEEGCARHDFALPEPLEQVATTRRARRPGPSAGARSARPGSRGARA